ncbi:MAG: undecaprenyl-diphosphate phosphatase [Sutterellaceae bacterium]|nr:undecaprenyl-diphosphate phosphatase [Sutterellaceae bacterium]MDD7442278.1 undecaprenyl-diphosphate phosphatase [Sutterellaceae bacterium]MDY2867750.1 undecaprenyl-diphosphate phosphatase [Mesosutterella sp.]
MQELIYLKAAILGIVEGLTEFLPISSTGHLILAGSLLNFTGDVAKVFEIAIQTGAMLAVIWEYRRKLLSTVARLFSDRVAQRFTANVVIAFIPAVVFGLALGGFIQSHLFSPIPVALALIVGGFLIFLIERKFGTPAKVRVNDVDDMTARDALAVGLLQCLALIPGTSRSGATIMGGMALGLSRKCATEFSFYLGIPTLMGAGVWSVWKDRALLHASDLPVFLIGLVLAFVSALVCIRWLIRYVSSHTFNPFAWYRIAFGVIIIATALSGLVAWPAA